VRALLVVLLAVLGAPPEPVAFPKAREAKDPTGRFTVVSTPAGNAGTGFELRLEGAAAGTPRALRSFVGTAVVFWSPDGKALAVTDRRADLAKAWLFYPDRPGEIDLDAELVKSLGPLPERTGNQHVFLEVVRWLDARKLRLRLRGWGRHDPEGFDELFDYEIGGRFRRANGLEIPLR
jgi:hypothetical protein